MKQIPDTAATRPNISCTPHEILSSTLFAMALAACSQPPSQSSQPPSPMTASSAPAPLPALRHGHRIEALGDGLLCFGGFAHRSQTADRGERETWFLAGGATRWLQRADMHHGHAFFGSAVVDGQVFAVGEAVERYDAEADRWQVITEPGQLPRSHFTAAAHEGRIFVLGGLPAVATGFSIIDPATGAVTPAAPPPSFAHGDHLHCMCSVAGELHVIGGMTDETSNVSPEHWVRSGDSWHRLPDCPVGVWLKFGVQVVLADKLYLFGEFGGHRYDAADQTWHRLSDLPAMVAMPVALAVGADIWVFGGHLVERRANVLWRYEVATDRWFDLLP